MQTCNDAAAGLARNLENTAIVCHSRVLLQALKEMLISICLNLSQDVTTLP